MNWYWIALIVGIVIPWFIEGRAIRIGFEEGGLQTGLGVWFGVSVLTIPFAFLFIWLGLLLLG